MLDDRVALDDEPEVATVRMMNTNLLSGHEEIAVGGLVEEARALHSVYGDLTLLDVLDEAHFKLEGHRDLDIFQVLEHDIVLAGDLLGRDYLVLVGQITHV